MLSKKLLKLSIIRINSTKILKKSKNKVKYCNVIRSHNMTYDRSNLIETILSLSKIEFSLVIYYLTHLTFLLNLSN